MKSEFAIEAVGLPRTRTHLELRPALQSIGSTTHGTFRIPEPALKRYLNAEETPTAP
jgi:hypothetical protein